MLKIPVPPTFKGNFFPFFCPHTCASCVNDDDVLQPAADDVGGGAPPPGDQRRRTIPRGAQFCSIYLQNHINKCCRIVQLLKSKAAR